MTTNQLKKAIERYFAAGPAAIGDPDAMAAFLALRSAIESGEVRAASPMRPRPPDGA
jgi:2,3,4,5-tetrahydropyridine-2-carboxylate N-succinyltransferase